MTHERTHQMTPTPQTHPVTTGPSPAPAYDAGTPKPCCANCLYARRAVGRWLRVILSRWPGLLLCINHADSPGELHEVVAHGVCPCFRPRPQPPVRPVLPEPPDDTVRYIALTRNKYALVDAADYEWLSRYKWYAQAAGDGRFYAFRSQNKKGVGMHRQIMQPPAGLVVDHIDGNGLNNRRSNLRICTPGENVCNRGNRRGKRTPKGVSRRKRGGKFHAQIRRYGRRYNLGAYDDPRDAARAYDRKALELHGPFARLNFPREDGPAGPREGENVRREEGEKGP